MEIKPGDLVMVVDDCCQHADDGTIGIVSECGFYAGNEGFECEDCGYRYDGLLVRLPHIIEYGPAGWIPARWVKKIDPPSEGDSLPTRADLKLEA